MSDDLIQRLQNGDQRRCPFSKGMPDPGLQPTDPCPICKMLGTDTAEDRCVESRTLAIESAAALTRLSAENAALAQRLEALRSDRDQCDKLADYWHSRSLANAAEVAALRGAAQALRAAQRAYMADRGNEMLGKAVGIAAADMDRALAASAGDGVN